jgi:hypothetical protein
MQYQPILLEDLINDIEQAEPQQVRTFKTEHTFELSLHPSLTEHLSGWIGAVVIRSLLQQLNINEHHVFRWRLENKYRQYQVLNYYVPGCMPSTFGLYDILKQPEGIQKIKDLISEGYFVKATLGHGSGRTKTFDQTPNLQNILDTLTEKRTNLEVWMLQYKLEIKVELRIHSFEKHIIPALTFPTGSGNLTDKYQVEEFVQAILQTLPASIHNGLLLAWDIAVIDNNRFQVIEMNVTGFHPEFAAGFQTTGYVDDETLGPIVCAWINTFLKYHYNVSIAGFNPPELIGQNHFLNAFYFFNELLQDKAQPLFHVSIEHKEGAVLYIEPQHLQLLLNFLTFLSTTACFKKYIILCTRSIYQATIKYIGNSKTVQVIINEDLFTEEQFQLIERLRYHSRKQLSLTNILNSQIHINDWILF